MLTKGKKQDLEDAEYQMVLRDGESSFPLRTDLDEKLIKTAKGLAYNIIQTYDHFQYYFQYYSQL